MKKVKSEKQTAKTKSSGKVAVISAAYAAFVIAKYSESYGDVDPVVVLDELIQAKKEISKGKLECVEDMLFNQAKALESIFCQMSKSAMNASYMQNVEVNLRLALKAQAQCTRTLATLANMKNPSNVSFVKQANIGANVQVNNSGASCHSEEKNLNSTNELLEEPNEQRLDTREKGEAVKVNTPVEAMEKVHRA